jgi:hypothetical protein
MGVFGDTYSDRRYPLVQGALGTDGIGGTKHRVAGDRAHHPDILQTQPWFARLAQ